MIAFGDAKVVMQVDISLHLDPPLAHTVHIEPLTPADWESKCVLLSSIGRHTNSCGSN